MEIKMIKIYNDGNGTVKKPGEIVKGKLAEKIKKEHPTWCKEIKKNKIKKDGDK